MANRNTLHKSRLSEFRAWLQKQGYVVLKPKGTFEVLRWENRIGKPMPILFDRSDALEHYTSNDAAFPFVKQFLRTKKQEKQAISAAHAPCSNPQTRLKRRTIAHLARRWDVSLADAAKRFGNTRKSRQAEWMNEQQKHEGEWD